MNNILETIYSSVNMETRQEFMRYDYLIALIGDTALTINYNENEVSNLMDWLNDKFADKLKDYITVEDFFEALI